MLLHRGQCLPRPPILAHKEAVQLHRQISTGNEVLRGGKGIRTSGRTISRCDFSLPPPGSWAHLQVGAAGVRLRLRQQAAGAPHPLGHVVW